MSKLFKNKKICIAIIVICILVLVGVIIGVSMKGDKDETETGKGGYEQEIIVHESDKDTVEEEAEGCLTESDSEDGPVLDEDNMIDFNGNGGEDNNTNDSTAEHPKEESKDTGSWGAFY